MIGTLFHYARKYIAPQWKRLFRDDQWLLSIAVSCAIMWSHVGVRCIRFEIINQLFTYNLMAFGFTIAALTIIFAVPGGRFTSLMFQAAELNPKRGVGPWEDALFIISWNGFVHFISLVGSLSLLATFFNLSKDHTPPIYSVDLWPWDTVLGIFLVVQIYSIIQFLMTLLSTFFFCASYIRNSRNEWKKLRPPSYLP